MRHIAMRTFGGRVLVVASLVLVVGACAGPAATGTPEATTAATALAPIATAPDVTPLPTLVPSPTSPTPSATDPGPTVGPEIAYPAEVQYANQFVMKVLVSDLNVRAKPSTTGAKLGKAPKGALFLMSDWPVKANGYTWYFGYQLVLAHPGVLPDLPDPVVNGGYDGVLSGWLATGSEANPFLLPVAPRCPSTNDLQNLQAMLSSEVVGCFGTTSIELTGTYGCGGCGGLNPGTFTPAWLADPLGYSFLSIDPSERIGPFAVHFPSDGPKAPADGSILKVTGHFNDAHASSCVIAPVDESGTPAPIAKSVATAHCDAQFVVDSFTVTGIDPRFPG